MENDNNDQKRKLEFVEKENGILDFWEKNNIFQEVLQSRKDAPLFTFYEGPPTANNKPGVHHVLARVYKDLFCRYKTMRGFSVNRKAGWDTHGLPVEISIEKKLGFKTKNDIESYGVDRFNLECKNSVFQYIKDWEENTRKIGYWVNLDDAYKTYDNTYMESVWRILKQIHNKNLIYKGYKVLPFCPRCGTGLSSHEVAQGYKMVKDPSIYIKFNLKDTSKLGVDNAKMLVWTTTPWTLMANVALAINTNVKYYLFNVDGENIICHLDLASVDFLKDKKVEKVKEIEGSSLIGLKYEPLFEDKEVYSQNKKAYEIVEASFVSSSDGTGVVHIAPAFGVDDMELGNEKDLSVILNVDESGKLMDKENILEEVRGMFFKDADQIIFDNLKSRGILLYGDMNGTEHEYPFCWRCDTPLIYRANESWFIKMSSLRDELLKNNEEINWEPEYIKHGRFGEWLNDIKDWALSRNRYWATPLPIWICEKCGKQHAVGSLEELKERGKGINENELPINTLTGEVDLHRPYIDNFYIQCDECDGKMKRTPEVIDCWFDSGAMPFAQDHFPFKYDDGNKLQDLNYYLDKGFKFPADFISEGMDQTRGWFYTLLAISTLLGFGPSYKNVVTLGLVLDAKGGKMSKSKGNVIFPEELIEKYGADSLRWYLVSASNAGDYKKFSEKDLLTQQRRVINTFFNVFKFYETYVKNSYDIKVGDKWLIENYDSFSILDKWVINKIEKSKMEFMQALDKYNAYASTKVLDELIDSFSRWYLRRSRKVMQNDNIKSATVFAWAIKEIDKMFAIFCPFTADLIWQECVFDTEYKSIHLDIINLLDIKINDELLNQMECIKELSTQALKIRQDKAIKVRQPLRALIIKNKFDVDQSILDILKDEINVKEIVFDSSISNELELDTNLTQDLISEGKYRELIRLIQDLRQESNYSPNDLIDLSIIKNQDDDFWKLVMDIKKDIRVNNFSFEKMDNFEIEREIKTDIFDFKIQMKKI